MGNTQDYSSKKIEDDRDSETEESKPWDAESTLKMKQKETEIHQQMNVAIEKRENIEDLKYQAESIEESEERMFKKSDKFECLRFQHCMDDKQKGKNTCFCLC